MQDDSRRPLSTAPIPARVPTVVVQRLNPILLFLFSSRQFTVDVPLADMHRAFPGFGNAFLPSLVLAVSELARDGDGRLKRSGARHPTHAAKGGSSGGPVNPTGANNKARAGTVTVEQRHKLGVTAAAAAMIAAGILKARR